MPLSGFSTPFGIEDTAQLRIRGLPVTWELDHFNMRYIFACSRCGEEVATCARDIAEASDRREFGLRVLSSHVQQHETVCPGSRENGRPKRYGVMLGNDTHAQVAKAPTPLNRSVVMVDRERDPKTGDFVYFCAGCSEEVMRFTHDLIRDFSEKQIEKLLTVAIRKHATSCKRLQPPPEPKRLRVIRMG